MSKIIKLPSEIADKIARKKKDFRIDFFRSGGPGGQHQNKTSTGVRITDSITGIQSECRETKSQDENKKIAFHKLVERLIEYYKNEIKIESERILKTIRTYKLTKNEVIDHRTGKKYPADRILNGKL